MSSNIFIKHTENPNKNPIMNLNENSNHNSESSENYEDSEYVNINLSVSKKDILMNIPHDAVTIPNQNLKDKIEWRWRIFKFPHKNNEVIEISFKKASENRLYINKFGDWVESNVDPIYDNFVVRCFYHYTD